MDRIHATTSVLIVADDPAVQSTLQSVFAGERFYVYLVRKGRDALRCLNHRHVDVILLDMTESGREGWDTHARIRSSSSVPIIMLISQELEQNLIRGPGLGVDDFVVKPFQPWEVMVRVQKVLRRKRRTGVAGNGQGARAYDEGRLVVDWDRKEIRGANASAPLTATEFRLLACLIDCPGRVLSHRQIAREVWKTGSPEPAENVKVHIRNLRQKFRQCSPERLYIISRRGHGYMFVAEPVEPPAPPDT